VFVQLRAANFAIGRLGACGVGITSCQAQWRPSTVPQVKLLREGSACVTLSAVHSPHSRFQVWLVLEYCDRGTLRDALDAGCFFSPTAGLNYPAILDTALDVARAMAHLHGLNVLHGDLKVGGQAGSGHRLGAGHPWLPNDILGHILGAGRPWLC
jgi:serine/threonine protein kinase